MIPKIIHYCWFGGKKIPQDVKKCIKSWKKRCPDYKIIKWDENNFDINCTEFVKEAYKNKAWAFVSDYARLKIIYENGGIYLDTDVELLRNLDELLNCDSYFAQQQNGDYIATGLGFGAIKGDKIIEEMMNIYEHITFDNNKKKEFACPILNTIVIKKHKEYAKNEITRFNNTIIYPAEYFDPIAPGDSVNLLCKKTYSVHHYTASWTKKSERIKRKIFNIIGQKRINKLKGILKHEKNSQSR